MTALNATPMTKMPTEAELRAQLAADPHLLDRLRADLERVGLEASVAARFVAGEIRERFRGAAKSLPSIESTKPNSAERASAELVHARQLLEEIAVCHALCDGAPQLTDARTLSPMAYKEMTRAVKARITRQQAHADQQRQLSGITGKHAPGRNSVPGPVR